MSLTLTSIVASFSQGTRDWLASRQYGTRASYYLASIIGYWDGSSSLIGVMWHAILFRFIREANTTTVNILIPSEVFIWLT